jgi:hypothetical protein
MMPTLLIMLVGVLTLLPVADVLAQARPNVTHVVIIKCDEDNDPTNDAAGDQEPFVHTCQDSREPSGVCGAPSDCQAGVENECAACLGFLAAEPRRCEAGTVFTGNIVVDQQSTPDTVNRSIQKYTFACHD